jgi:hypothetical protein
MSNAEQVSCREDLHLEFMVNMRRRHRHRHLGITVNKDL